jgi:hypothetical protein
MDDIGSLKNESNAKFIAASRTLGPAMAKALIAVENLCNEGLGDYRKHDKEAIDVMAQCFIEALATIQRIKENG